MAMPLIQLQEIVDDHIQNMRQHFDTDIGVLPTLRNYEFVHGLHVQRSERYEEAWHTYVRALRTCANNEDDLSLGVLKGMLHLRPKIATYLATNLLLLEAFDTLPPADVIRVSKEIGNPESLIMQIQMTRQSEQMVYHRQMAATLPEFYASETTLLTSIGFEVESSPPDEKGHFG